ncbi:alpha/beta hydrolase [Streptomyces thermoalcalitolerans]|uniref:Alpha/beta hydrolase n=1 Tax=Streptomyces thermoalcalitolerans TaxID=65605 RepID=A0ABN1NZF7_9ACTN
MKLPRPLYGRARRIRTRSVGVATLLGTALIMAAAPVGGPPAVPDSGAQGKDGATAQQRPTVVLVHGAFADSSSWNGVIQRLKDDGYNVVAAANPLRDVAGDAAYLRGVLDTIEGPIVLVGHSYGGFVITEAAAGDPDVKALVYAASFLPEKNESASALSAKFPGSTLNENVTSFTYRLPDGSTGTDLVIKPDKFHEQFAADVPAAQAALMAATQRPIAASALDDKPAATAWKSIPSWVLLTSEDRNIPVAVQRWMAERAGARTKEVRSSHAVMVSHPDVVADFIADAARATAQ